MSQFLASIGPRPNFAGIANVSAQALAEAPGWVPSAVAPLGIEPDAPDFWFIVDETGDTADDLFTEAEGALAGRSSKSRCRLWAVLDACALNATSVVAWFGTDCEELEQFTDLGSFVAHVEASLSSGNEVYAQLSHEAAAV